MAFPYTQPAWPLCVCQFLGLSLPKVGSVKDSTCWVSTLPHLGLNGCPGALRSPGFLWGGQCPPMIGLGGRKGHYPVSDEPDEDLSSTGVQPGCLPPPGHGREHVDVKCTCVRPVAKPGM